MVVEVHLLIRVNIIVITLIHIIISLLLQLHWFLCVRLLTILLLQAFPHAWLPPDCGVFWLHHSHMLHLLPNDGDCVLLCITEVCQIHLPEHQNGLIYNVTIHAYYQLEMQQYIDISPYRDTLSE